MNSQCYLKSAIDISHPSKGFKLYTRCIIWFISVWIICKFQEIKIFLQTLWKLDFKLKALMKRLPRDAIFCNEFKVHYMFIWIISSAFHTMLLFIILYKDAKAWKGLDASIEKYILQHYTEGICETMQQIANGFICAFLALPRWSC